jgi:hypothetical protein
MSGIKKQIQKNILLKTENVLDNVHTMADIVNYFRARTAAQMQSVNTTAAVWKKILFSMDGKKENFDGQKSHNGENLFYHSKIIDKKNGALVIEVDHPGWITLFQFSQKYILNGFKRFAPELNITSLSFVLAGQKTKTLESQQKKVRGENRDKAD